MVRWARQKKTGKKITKLYGPKYPKLIKTKIWEERNIKIHNKLFRSWLSVVTELQYIKNTSRRYSIIDGP